MADVCSCCGREKSLLDVNFDYIEIDNELYGICGRCWINISAYNSGSISIDEVISGTTNKKIADYIKNIKSDETIELEEKEKNVLNIYKKHRKIIRYMMIYTRLQETYDLLKT